jgi:hypothetical protein
MDNLSAHTEETVPQLIEDQGARLEFLLPYTPDFNRLNCAVRKSKQLCALSRPLIFKTGLSIVAISYVNLLRIRSIEQPRHVFFIPFDPALYHSIRISMLLSKIAGFTNSSGNLFAFIFSKHI